MISNSPLRDRTWQWRRAGSDALTVALITFGAVAVATRLVEHGEWWRWVVTVSASVLAVTITIGTWLRTFVRFDGTAVTVRNPLRTHRIPVSEVAAVTARKAIGPQRYLALVRQAPNGRNAVVALKALPVAAVRDPEVLSRLPFLTELVGRSFL